MTLREQAEEPGPPVWREGLVQFVEGLDWFVGGILLAFGALGLGADALHPSREGLFPFLSLAALAVGAPIVLAAIAFRRRWSLRWLIQALAIVWPPVFWSIFVA